jgi:PAS domain S-box-containing protein
VPYTMNRRSIGKFHRPVQVLIVLILLATGYLSYRNWHSVRRRLDLGGSARQQLVATIEMFSLLKDAETGQRGYLLTGSDDYLAPYRAAVAEIPGLEDRLRKTLDQDPPLYADFQLLRTLSKAKMAELELTINLRREKGFQAAVEVVGNNSGKKTMDSIRELAVIMTARETAILETQRAGILASSSSGFLFTWAGLVCLFMALLALEWAVHREAQGRSRLAETLDQAHVVINKPDGTILYWNRVAESIYGWTAEEARGKKQHELLHAEFSKPYREVEAELFESGSWNGEIRQSRRDGSTLWVASHWALQYDRHGERSTLIKMSSDITNHKRTEEALQVSETTVRTLFENASQGILLVDEAGRLIDANSTLGSLFGYSREELIGATVETLLPENLRTRHLEHRTGYASNPVARAMGSGMDLVGRRKDGSEFPIEISLSSVAKQNSMQTLAFVSDITVRKENDQIREALIGKLERALEERNVLLQEVHHRVKNNLAVIIGLLGMQSSSLEDERLTNVLAQSQQRVASMAMIHEFLYSGGNMKDVNFGEYVQQLTSEVCASYAVRPDPLAVTVEMEQILIPVHRAIPCGLILNELLSNALKYAFAEGRTGKLTVRFVRLESGELSLSCLDNGVGIPEGFDWRHSPSMGLKIVQILAKQLHGELTLDRTHGTRFELRFPESVRSNAHHA